MTRHRRPLTMLLLVALSAPPAWAAPAGSAFTYQGRLLDNGTPPTGPYDLQFTVYDVPAGGAPLFAPVVVDDVAVAAGLFTVSLDFGASAFTGEARFMEIGVRPGASSGAFTPLSGRQELRPTPNALAAPWAGVHGKPAGFADDVDNDVLGGLGCAPGEVAKWSGSAWACAPDANAGGDITDVTAGAGLTGGGSNGAVTLQANFAGSGSAASVPHSDHDHFAQTWTGNAGNGLQVQNGSAANDTSALRGTSTAATGLVYGVYGSISSSDQGAGVQGSSLATSGFGYGVIGTSASTFGGIGVYGRAESTASYNVGVWGQTYSTGGYGMYGFNGGSTGQSVGVGAGTNSTTGRALVGQAIATQGTNYGVYGVTQSSQGRGVYGLAQTTTGVAWGVEGVSNSSIGRGVAGSVTATTGPVVGVQGFINSDDGAAVQGFANAITGQADGVTGSTNAPSGVGVYGGATGSGTTYGTFGFAQSPTGYGLYGWNQSLTGGSVGVYGLVYSTAGYGLYGNAQATSGLNYGIYARTQSTAGYAGYFQGRVHVNGTLSKLAGSFKIDHPLDPENKYLSHSFVESPDMKNIYDGVVTTDATGYATVELPAWFEALNSDFRYQLTVIDEGDAFVLAKVASKIAGNRFVVRTNRAGVEVSWQVTGIRKDPYAEKNRIPVEEDKPEAERGRYLSPAAYGLGEEHGVHYDPVHDSAAEPEKLPRFPTAPVLPSHDPDLGGS